jgi:ubiquitin carboxyl-terminal hydrolase 7
MQIRDCPTLEDSINQYIAYETLDGANQWDADEHGKQEARMGREFLEFPPILQLHLRRFEYDYDLDRNAKVNAKFEFPTEIDLAPFLAQTADRSRSHVYELYGVLVHAGDVSFGHYYAYLRTTTGPQWYEFNDEWVKKVKPEKAIQSNFGGTVKAAPGAWYLNKRTYENAASAYILVYIRRSDAQEIMRPLLDEEVPEHVRNSIDQPEDDDPRLKRKDKIDLYELDEAIRRNVLSNRFGFIHKDCVQTVKFELTDSNERIYERIATFVNVPINELRLWQGYSANGAPSTAIARDEFLVTAYIGQGPVFWIRKPADEPLIRDYAILTLYLKFFCSEWSAPLQYLGQFVIDHSEKCSVVIAEVNRRMGTPADTELRVYEENLTLSVRRLTFSPNEELLMTGVWTGYSLIFEFPPNNPVPPITFVPSAPIDPPPAEGAGESEGSLPDVPVHCLERSDSSATSLEQWVSRHVATPLAITLFAYPDAKTPIAVLHAPSTTTWSDFCDFIARAAGLDYVSNQDTILIYRKDYYGEGPEQRPLSSASYPTIQYLFYGTGKRFLFYRFLKGVDPGLLATGFLLTVDLTTDFRTVARSVDVPLSRNATFSEMRERLEASDFLTETPCAVVFLAFEDGKVAPCEDRDWVYETCRYIVAPAPPEDALFVTVVEIDSTDYLTPVNLFAPLEREPGLTLGAAREKIATVLGLDPAGAPRWKIFAGGRWVHFTPASALADNYDLGALQPGDTLFVVVSTKRRPSRWHTAEEAVRIAN